MKRIYNYSIALLAVSSIVFLILDLCNIINLLYSPFKQIDIAILAIFTIDYFTRLFLSKERKKFFKENIFDLIAIIPFNSIFSAFRVFRLFRLLKVTKFAKIARVVRTAAYFGVLKRKIGDILKTNGFLYVLYANITMILFSSVIMMFAEKMTFGDSLWWSIVTCTTVGYGDISPTTSIGRILAVILMTFGIGLIGMLTGAITTYFTSNHSKQHNTNDETLDTLIQSMNDEQKEKMIEIAKILLK